MVDFPYKFRPLCPEKDSVETAQLIRCSFRPWLDQNDLDSLDRLENAGRDALAHPYMTNFTGFPYPSEGIVCEDTVGKIIGLINTYHFQIHHQKCVLLANVCVAEEYRNRGIAAHMLSEVECSQKANGVFGIYLQARMERTDVLSFYRRKGFRISDYRDTWILPRHKPFGKNADDVFYMERVSKPDMKNFWEHFHSRYPDSILWTLDYRKELFRPGLSGQINNLLTSFVNRFFRLVNSDKHTIAWGAFQSSKGFADELWFLPERNDQNEVLVSALKYLQTRYKGSKPLKIDTPTGKETGAYQTAGLTLMHRLAYMWKKL